MICPKCKGTHTNSLEARTTKLGTWRKRKCPDCGLEFYTVETCTDKFAKEAIGYTQNVKKK